MSFHSIGVFLLLFSYIGFVLYVLENMSNISGKNLKGKLSLTKDIVLLLIVTFIAFSFVWSLIPDTIKHQNNQSKYLNLNN